jgi:hypothetical protein
MPVLLVGLLGAYIVFHMWQLTETGPGKSHLRTPAEKRLIGHENSPQVKEKPSPDPVVGRSAE